MGILSFVIIFGVLVSLHELGHFVTARLFKVHVLEFGIGIPPRVWGFKRGGTTYSLNALPIGGFVKMLGEEDSSDPRSLAARPAWQRACVIGAGAFMNAVLALVLFAVVFMVPQDTRVGDVTVLGVASGSPAALAGLREGDVIREVNGRTVENFRDLHFQYQLRRGATATTVVERGGALLPFDVIPRWKVPPGEGLTGIRVDLLNERTVSQSEPFWNAVPMAGKRIADSVVLMKNGISSWFSGGSDPLDEVSGPVGIVQVTGEVAGLGIVPLLTLAALLSLNLAILNILPFPALDGGRLFFIAVEVLRGGKRIPPHREALAHAMGFALLMVVFLAVTYNDILRWVGGGSPLGG